MEIAQLIITIISSIGIPLLIYYLDYRRRKEEKEKQTKDEAKIFTKDHYNDLEYLALCKIAFLCFPKGGHSRKIYNDFCVLDEDVKKEVLKMNNISDELYVGNGIEWTYSKIEDLRNIIKKYDLGEYDYLYDGGKYIHRLNNYKNYNINKFQFELNDCRYQDCFGLRDDLKFVNKRLTMLQYLDDYFYSKIKGVFREEYNIPAPIDYVSGQELLGSCDEPKLCYFISVVAKEIMLISSRYLDYSIDLKDLKDLQINKYEDFYYEILYYLYNWNK